MAEQEKKTEIKDKYVLKEVPTQTGVFVGENDNDNILDDKQVLLEILNTLNRIEKAVI